MGGRLPCIIFCSSVTFRQACRETKCIKAPRHCLYASFLPHCTCRCRHKSRLGGPGRPPAVHESRIQNGEHISYNWVNFSSLVTAVVITFNFRVHLHHIPYSTARLLLLRHPTFFAPGKFYCLTVYKFLSSWLNLATELGLNLYRPLVIVVQHCVGYTSISSPARGKKERSRWQFETQVVFFTVPLLFNL